jgi:hypothetical protein
MLRVISCGSALGRASRESVALRIVMRFDTEMSSNPPPKLIPISTALGLRSNRRVTGRLPTGTRRATFPTLAVA